MAAEQRVFEALEVVERWVADAGVFLTLFTLVFWLFLPGVALIGPRSWLWIPIGGAIVCIALPLGFTIFHERRRLEASPGPRIAFKLLQTSRGAFALLGAWALFRAVAAASDGDASWRDAGSHLLRILTG